MINDLSNYEIGDEDAIEYKLILIGDSSVGKTCLFKKIGNGIFLNKTVSTVGVDKKSLQFTIELEENGKKVMKNIILNLTDTAGQERYKSITKSYYKGSNGILLIYDITDRKSFEHLEEWIKSIKSSVGNYEEKYLIFLMGSKLDLVIDGKRERGVTEEEAKKICKEFELEWGGECSSKTFTEEQYKDIFKEFIKKLFKRIGYNKNVRQTVATLDSYNKNKKKGNCGC